MADRNKTIGVRIARVREKAGDKQADLAAALGVKREMVTYWENGTRAIKAEMLLAIADRYGVNADYLLGRTDEPTVKEDIRIACKTTGLSEKAIKNIHACDSLTLLSFLENSRLSGFVYSFQVAGLVAREIEAGFDSNAFSKPLLELLRDYKYSRYDLAEATLDIFDSCYERVANLVAGANMVIKGGADNGEQ